MPKDLNLIYKESLAKYLQISQSNIFLFWKGRVAFYAILKALGIKEGDEVIIPAFTCVVVPNAIIYLGAKPVYVDINPDTYNIDLNKLEAKITTKTKVILAQNTFGLAPDLDSIIEIAKKYNLRVIEDCTHGFGGKYKEKLNGTIADASFFSTQWNKPFSTGIGGIAVVKDFELIEKLQSLERNLLQPNFKEKAVLKILFFIRENLLPSFLYWTAIKAYRTLSSRNLIVGSSSGKELEKPVMEDDFFKGVCEFQAKKGVDGIKKIDQVSQHRIRVAARYTEFLKNMEKRIPFIPNYSLHTFLKYPILVRDRAFFIAEAEKRNIELGEWFFSPIHPIMEDYHLWFYNYGDFPIAEYTANKIVNLPTHEGITPEKIEKILTFLFKYRHLVK